MDTAVQDALTYGFALRVSKARVSLISKMPIFADSANKSLLGFLTRAVCISRGQWTWPRQQARQKSFGVNHHNQWVRIRYLLTIFRPAPLPSPTRKLMVTNEA